MRHVSPVTFHISPVNCHLPRSLPTFLVMLVKAVFLLKPLEAMKPHWKKTFSNCLKIPAYLTESNKYVKPYKICNKQKKTVSKLCYITG